MDEDRERKAQDTANTLVAIVATIPMPASDLLWMLQKGSNMEGGDGSQ